MLEFLIHWTFGNPVCIRNIWGGLAKPSSPLFAVQATSVQPWQAQLAWRGALFHDCLRGRHHLRDRESVLDTTFVKVKCWAKEEVTAEQCLYAWWPSGIICSCITARRPLALLLIATPSHVASGLSKQWQHPASGLRDSTCHSDPLEVRTF